MRAARIRPCTASSARDLRIVHQRAARPPCRVVHAHQFGFLACLRSYQDLVDSSTLLTPNQPVIGGDVLAGVLVVLALTLWGLHQRWLRVTGPRSGDVRVKGETPKPGVLGGARVGAHYTS